MQELPFTFKATADGRVLISWRGRIVTTLAGIHAERFLKNAHSATPDQMLRLLARATKNFKR